MGDVSGLETLEFRRIGEDITIANLQSLDTEIVMSNISTAEEVVINFDANEVSGTSDTASVTINSTTGGANLDINGVETIAITVVGEDNDLNIDGDDLETVTVAGAGDLNMDVDASVETVDASLSTGGVRIVFTAAQDVTATGGSGDDTFAFGAGLYDEDDVVDGGDGVDTLNIFAFNTNADETYSSDNIETLRIETDDDGAAEVMDLDLFSSDFTTVRVDVGTANAANTLTLQDVANSSTILVTNNTSGTDATLTALNVTLSSDTGADDVANIILRADGNDDAVDLTLTTLGLTAVETLNLTLDATSEGSINIGTITVNAIETLNVSGAADAELGSVDGMTIEIINASTATGDIEFNLGAGDHEVTGGSGDDTFTFASTFGSTDTVDGGEGDDTLNVVLAAGTAAATVTNVESANLEFAVAGSTFSGANVSADLTSIEIDEASDEAVNLVNLKAAVASVRLGATHADAANDAATIRYANGSDSAHTVIIGDATATPDDVDLGALTIAGNEGALTITSDGLAAGNTVASITANAADELTIVSEVIFTNEGVLNATSALSATFISDGGDMTITGVQTLGDATSIVIDAADGNITLTGAMTATDAETLTVTATDDFLQTGNFLSDADIAVSLTADGSSASIRYDGVLDVDHATSIALTAIDGGSVIIDDIELLGVDEDDDDIDTTITITSTGEDREGVESVVTVSAIDVAAAATLASIVIVSDEDGEVNLTTGGANLTVTEINATASAGTLVLNTSSLDAATEINLGAGTNTITTDASFADEINLAFEAGTDTINIQALMDAEDVVTDFQAGDDGDVLRLDVSALNPGGVAGGVINGGGFFLSDVFSVNIQDDADGTVADLLDATNIIRITNTLADTAALVAALAVVGGGDNAEDNEDFLVLWTDGASSYLAVATADGVDLVDFEKAENLIELVGVAVTDLTADNFAFV